MTLTDDEDCFEAPLAIRRMLFATWALLYSLSPEWHARAVFEMDHPSRMDWDFIPKPDRSGVPLFALDPHQKSLAHTLLAAGLSVQGYSQALEIMALENILREIDVPRLGLPAGDFRNSDGYFLSFYGRPGFDDTWSWRILGHHLSLCYTIVNQRFLTATPCNMGAQPASAGVLNPLGTDEDQAFRLLDALPERQRSAAIIHTVAPADYATRQVPRIGKVELPDRIDLGIPWYEISAEDRELLAFRKDSPAGVCASELGDERAALLLDLVDRFLGRMPDEWADKQRARVRRLGLDNLYFCWAGATQPGAPHYFRIQGSEILIEFDNAIDNGNHIHSVVRDYRNDLGHQLLRDHYRATAGTPHHLRARLTSTVPEDEE